MTAFGRIEETTEFGHVVWDIRSVNHRYLDINLRLPEEMRMLENSVRQKIAGTIKRGKVDCTLRFDADAGAHTGISLNRNLAKKVIEAAHSLGESGADAGALNPIEIMRWPGVIEREPVDIDAVGTTLLALLDKALLRVKDTRETEGEKIQQMINGRCQEVAAIIARLQSDLPAIIEALRDKLNARIAELAIEVDPDRLEQEVVLQAQKMDVAEELDRLEAHIAEVRRALDAANPVGRRLDFLMQEMNREANTLGSKSADIKMTNTSVDLKVLIEQMREQIQNIE
jgi:uncharacterized protein (TIGR00255 family)